MADVRLRPDALRMRAQQCRVLAESFLGRETSMLLLCAAADYDRMADELERLAVPLVLVPPMRPCAKR
jgi:hypothetical protein